MFSERSLTSQAIRAMRETLARLRAEGRAAAVEDRIASLSEVFDLVRLDELRAAEQRYLLRREKVR